MTKKKMECGEGERHGVNGRWRLRIEKREVDTAVFILQVNTQVIRKRDEKKSSNSSAEQNGIKQIRRQGKKKKD